VKKLIASILWLTPAFAGVTSFLRKQELPAARMAGLLFALPGVCDGYALVRLSPHVSVCQDTVNGVFIEDTGRTLVIYGDPSGCVEKADMVLFTHSRRDVVWAGRKLIQGGAESIVPRAEADNFTKANDFWLSFVNRRYHDYEQQTTKILTEPLPVSREVAGGDQISWQARPERAERDISVQVLDTPGYTRGAVSYFINVDGLTYGFVGDLIYGDGHLMDWYSLQDAVAEAGIGGYHGYAGRLGELIMSLRKVTDQNPDILVPAHGPVIRNPKQAIERLIQRLQAAYANYLSINAGHWYFKERYEVLAKRVLGTGFRVDWMPYAEVIEKAPPGWIIPIHNSRLLLSADKSGFLIDCGSDAIIREVAKLKEEGRLSRLDGVFITHYHDDHTDKVSELVKKFGCPVYASQQSADVLAHPAAYRLPCLTSNAISNLTAVPDGHKMRWKEFDITIYYFPGQTLYHDALLVEKEGGETPSSKAGLWRRTKIFFIGDSFTPSGIDDYCLQNRNFLHQGTGYFYCLDILRKMPPNCLLINQHVLEPFRFSPDQLDHMTKVLEERRRILADLFPWDEPDYGIDEQWARIYPYGQQAKAGQCVGVTVKILNHSSSAHTYTASLNVPEGLQSEPKSANVRIEPREEAQVHFEITLPQMVSKNLYVVTCDVEFDIRRLRDWCECLIEIYP
jgi:glyoxylase-like metal-dependent hydrolase (beta-lactamase superfamily II)